METADQVLERLKAGNRRFVSKLGDNNSQIRGERLRALAEGQRPCAVVLGCSDSRVPVEIVFDQDLGDLFVIRVAGNIAKPSQIGSVEFAAEAFGTRLVVVLGHSRCGAILATLDNWNKVPTPEDSPNLQEIVDEIRPALAPLVDKADRYSKDELVERAVRANVHRVAERIRHGSAYIERLVRQDGLRIVGAEYDLNTGEVDFFDIDLPAVP